MAIDELISLFADCNEKLLFSIQENAEPDVISMLDQEANSRLEQVRQYSPTSPKELKTKISFFLDFIQKGPACNKDTFALEALTEILRNDFEVLENQHESKP